MNAQTPFWPLVRNEVGIDHYSTPPDFIGLIYCLLGWGAMGSFPLFLLFNCSPDSIATLLAPLDAWLTFFWLAGAAIFFGNALIPRKSTAVTNVRAFEFLFTRAVDRKKLYRAKAATVFLVMLAPVFIDLLASLVFWHGTQAYIGWLLWSGILTLLLVQGSCALIGKHLKGSGWLMFVVLGAPILAVLTLAFWFYQTTLKFYEGSFVLFSAHPIPAAIALAALAAVIQLYSERRFAELEIP